MRSLGALLLIGALVACSSKGDGGKGISRADFTGSWRIVFDSPGGALPIALEIFSKGAPGPNGAPAVYRNGAHEQAFSEVVVDGRRINLRVEHRDAALTATLSADGKTLVGTWQVVTHDGDSALPIVGYKGATERFVEDDFQPPGAGDAVASVDGAWEITFGSDGKLVGVAEFKQEGEQVSGSIIHPAGSYRYLAGRYKNGVLLLSMFNGGEVALVRARAQKDGSLKGGAWVNDEHYTSFKGQPTDSMAAATTLRDPYSQVKVISPNGRIEFEFSDTEGKKLSMEAPRFESKVVLVELFGTWCSNCNDAAPHLVDWYQKYHKEGLEIVGLAYEHTGDAARDLRQVQRFKEHYKIPFPLLLAGTSDLSRPLESISEISMYPTTLFIGRDGKVQKIHTGFLGPSSGEHYKRQVAQLEADIKELLQQ